jgi:magnesium-dependent phosphatase 1
MSVSSEPEPEPEVGLFVRNGVQMIVYDLDATLWETEMYLIDGPPFSETAEPHVLLDRSKTKVEIMAGALESLQAFQTDERWRGVKVGIASRTDYPKWARECMARLRVPKVGDDDDDASSAVTLQSLVDFEQIFDDDKRNHFRALHKESGVPFANMVFFDNEHRNIVSVSKLGVQCVFCPDGMTRAVWNAFVQSQSQSASASLESESDSPE